VGAAQSRELPRLFGFFLLHGGDVRPAFGWSSCGFLSTVFLIVAAVAWGLFRLGAARFWPPSAGAPGQVGEARGTAGRRQELVHEEPDNR
jgi:hypothetical protein